ncbi:MAG: hypothetical protein U5R30_15995 [Deltaproteobacteria bacterium]|nr:hypothetical protein [Deltaproteobacteria bacterium]
MFRLVATGMLNNQAAFDLGVTEKTIKVHHDREIHIICRSAQRAYCAMRILLHNGIKIRNISGGMLSCNGSC